MLVLVYHFISNCASNGTGISILNRNLTALAGSCNSIPRKLSKRELKALTACIASPVQCYQASTQFAGTTC